MDDLDWLAGEAEELQVDQKKAQEEEPQGYRAPRIAHPGYEFLDSYNTICSTGKYPGIDSVARVTERSAIYIEPELEHPKNPDKIAVRLQEDQSCIAYIKKADGPKLKPLLMHDAIITDAHLTSGILPGKSYAKIQIDFFLLDEQIQENGKLQDPRGNGSREWAMNQIHLMLSTQWEKKTDEPVDNTRQNNQ